MSDQGNVAGGFGVGLLVGVAIGASLALLHAPTSGEKTRKLIRDKVEDAWDAGADRIAESRKQGKGMLTRVQ